MHRRSAQQPGSGAPMRIATQEGPDLSGALILAFHRDKLIDRNTRIPVGLPAVWAALGNVTRAEALVACIPEPGRQTLARTQVAKALATAGLYQRAAELAHVLNVPDPQSMQQATVTLAVAGFDQPADDLIRSIGDPGEQARVLAEIARMLVAAGRPKHAEITAELRPRCPLETQLRLRGPLQQVLHCAGTGRGEDRGESLRLVGPPERTPVFAWCYAYRFGEVVP